MKAGPAIVLVTLASCPATPTLPEFTFDADDVGAIIAYLKSIQQR
jgi:hypothetical protein